MEIPNMTIKKKKKCEKDKIKTKMKKYIQNII